MVPECFSLHLLANICFKSFWCYRPFSRASMFTCNRNNQTQSRHIFEYEDHGVRSKRLILCRYSSCRLLELGSVDLYSCLGKEWKLGQEKISLPFSCKDAACSKFDIFQPSLERVSYWLMWDIYLPNFSFSVLQPQCYVLFHGGLAPRRSLYCFINLRNLYMNRYWVLACFVIFSFYLSSDLML